VEEVLVKTSKPAEAEELIARRLESTLRITREDEAKFKRIVEVRRLRRRAKQGLRSK
jgi:hypothetical protein